MYFKPLNYNILTIISVKFPPSSCRLFLSVAVMYFKPTNFTRDLIVDPICLLIKKVSTLPVV